MRGQRGGDFFGGGADIDEQRAAIGNLRRRRRTDRLLLVGGDEAARLVSEVLDSRSDDRAAVNPRQRTMIDKVVQILADGLRRHLEAAGEIVHRHPAEGAGDVQNLGLAMA